MGDAITLEGILRYREVEDVKAQHSSLTDHPASLYDHQGLFRLYSLSFVGHDQQRYGRLAPS
jgi:hypothetical protein